jgi:four helix bundle protein
LAKIETYKDLKVWQQGIEIAKSTYLLCSNLPENEKFGLISQMKRSSMGTRN